MSWPPSDPARGVDNEFHAAPVLFRRHLYDLAVLCLERRISRRRPRSTTGQFFNLNCPVYAAWPRGHA